MASHCIILDNLCRDDVRALISSHVTNMHDATPSEFAHALDIDALRSDDIDVWTLWGADALMGCGALYQIDDRHGEIKSMRTHEDYLRQGVAAKLLEHIIRQARLKQYQILSLETGTSQEFEPAVKLYEKYGFQKGRAFGSYSESPYNQFYHLTL